MRKYLKKIIECIGFALVFILVFFNINNGVEYKANNIRQEESSYPDTSTDSFQKAKDINFKVLTIWNPKDEISIKYKNNIEEVLRALQMDSTLLETDNILAGIEDIYEYDMVIIAFDNWDRTLYNQETVLMDYVKNGGKIFWGIMPDTADNLILSIYRHLGIVELGTYEEDSGIYFDDELIPSAKGMKFDSEGFRDTTMSVHLETNARVYLSSVQNNNPLMWTFDYGSGVNIVFNGTSITGDYFTGLLAGCILSGFEEYIYPIINAKCIFIDDFPSKQYETDSKVIKEEYNRSAKEFYRDIWWPSMQSIAEKYDYLYTGMFVLTYDDEVLPDKFYCEKDTMEQYYGNSLLKTGSEIGVHGYNHQSLTLEGGTPVELGYRPWRSKEDMSASIKFVVDHMKDIFPKVVPVTYVPPSNYLSSTGRDAVKAAMPELKVISGVYTDESETGEVYARKFGVSDDGIVEFPRITSGMLESSYEDFIAIGGCSLYGVFSHFIHPDDVLDEERGNGNTWENLQSNFCKRLHMINQCYSNLRPMTASMASDEVVKWDEIDIMAVYERNRIIVKLNNFYDEAYFYVKSEREITTGEFEGYEISKVNDATGKYYYIVKCVTPEFSIELEEN